jgi:hypothetical protein
VAVKGIINLMLGESLLSKKAGHGKMRANEATLCLAATAYG